MAATTGTLAPYERRQYFDNNGLPLANGRLYTYLAGTDTPRPIYTDVLLAVAHPNPAILDGAGRITVYLTPGSSYKFILKDENDAIVWTQDNIPSTPPSTPALDIDGVTGDGLVLSANTPVYLGDDGKWRPSRADTASTITFRQLGMTITGVTGPVTPTPIRLAGPVTGFSGLTPGAAYYVGQTGGITKIWQRGTRRLGYADANGVLIMHPEDQPETAGFHDLWLPSLAFQPRTASAPCGNHQHIVDVAVGAEVIALPFVADVVQWCFINFRLPRSWDPAAGLGVEVAWINNVGGTGNVYWAYFLQRVIAGGHMLPQPLWAYQGNHLSPALAAYNLQGNTSPVLPLTAGTPTGNGINMLVGRFGDQGTDTYPSPALLVGVNLRFKTIANNDD